MKLKKNKIKVIVPFYNPGDFLEICIKSIMSQNYDNFQVIFIDDASTDNSWNKLPHNDLRVMCIKNESNLTALPNLHNAIVNHCDKDDLVCIVDGDDWLAKKNALSYINDFYNENNCWFMYGNSTASDGTNIVSKAYNEESFKRIREGFYFVSHIRTFKAGLYHKIKDQDENFSCLKDINGNFYKMTYDVAMFVPMLEMAGFNRIKFNEKVLYVYNRQNPLSDCYVNENLQKSIHIEINKKNKFKKIDSL